MSLLIIGLLSPGSSRVQAANRVELPDGVHYHRFASSVNGPEASWINPAVLGFLQGISGQVTGEIHDGKFAKNWGFNTVGDRIGISYRHLDDFGGEDCDEYIFGSGFRFGHGYYLGVSYRYVSDAPDYLDDTHYWNIALLVRQNPQFSLAAVFSNLNREEIDGENRIAVTPSGALLITNPAGEVLQAYNADDWREAYVVFKEDDESEVASE